MGGIGELWLNGVVSPLTTVLASLISVTGSAALGIVALTIIVRIVLLPLAVMQIRSQKKMLALQPELKAIQKRYAKDAEKRAQEQMRLYKENGVQPALGCLPLVLQMPILFGLYQALNNLAHYNLEPYRQYITAAQAAAAPTLQAPFMYLPCGLAGPDGIPKVFDACAQGTLMAPQWLAENFLSIASVHVPGPMLIVMTVLSYAVQKMMVMPSADPQQQQMNKMMAFMPLMYLFLFSSVPAGLVLYWLVTNVFSIVQQYFISGPGALSGLLPGGGAAAESSPAAGALVEQAPGSNGVAEDGARSERRPAARSGRRRKSGRR